MGVRYATREAVKNALDTRSTARTDAQVDRAVESASRAIDELCHRHFYPVVDTRYFDWPNENEPYAPSWRLWLHQHEVLSVTTLTAGGTTLTEGTDFFLEPVNDGPPYRWVEINRGSSAAFNNNLTAQRAIAIAGMFGGHQGEELVATVSSTITTAHTTLTFSPEQVGVGDTVHIDDEYIHLTGLSFADTTQDLAAGLAASTAATQVTVADGTGFAAGEVIRVGGEAMLIIAITGNTLVVHRAYDGSVLAAHDSGDDIYAERAFTAQRGALGSTIAEHLANAEVYRLTYPPLVVDLAVGEAVVRLQQEQSAYARPISNFHKSVIDNPTGIDLLREDVYTAHGRKMRTHAI